MDFELKSQAVRRFETLEESTINRNFLPHTKQLAKATKPLVVCTYFLVLKIHVVNNNNNNDNNNKNNNNNNNNKFIGTIRFKSPKKEQNKNKLRGISKI